MENREFYDHIYQVWSRTTKAETGYWMPEEYDGKPGNYRIVAVNQDGGRKLVASYLSDEDSDFISAVHGCFPDLIRSLGAAHDEADRLDLALDAEINEKADLIQEVDNTSQTLMYANDTLGLYRVEIADKAAEISKLKDQLESALRRRRVLPVAIHGPRVSDMRLGLDIDRKENI